MKKIILLMGILILLMGIPASAEEIVSVSAPSNVTTALRITWKKNSKATGYIIYRDGVRIKKVANTVNYYSNIGLQPGKKYTYQVQSFVRKKDGSIVYGAKGEAKFGVTNLKMPVLGEAWSYGSKIKVSWKPVTNARAYKIYRKTKGSGWITVGRSTSTVFVDRTTQTGVTYYYTVRAYSLYDKKEYLSMYNTKGIQSKNVIIKLSQQNQNAELYIDVPNKKEIQLTATVVGESQEVVWWSGDSSVVTVKNGKVTAKGEGETRVYAKANGITTSCLCFVRKYYTLKEGLRLYSLNQYKEAQKIFDSFPAKYTDPTEKTMPSYVKKAYLNYINEYRRIVLGNSVKLDIYSYYLTDIDKDGIAEMILCYSPHFVGDVIYFVTYRNGKVEDIDYDDHVDGMEGTYFAYPEGNGVIRYRQKQLGQWIYLQTLKNNKIETKRIGIAEYKDWVSLPYELNDHCLAYQNGKYVLDLTPFL